MQRTDAMVMISLLTSLHPTPRKYKSLGTENTGPSSCLGKLKSADVYIQVRLIASDCRT
jgi:hypothetical protein